MAELCRRFVDFLASQSAKPGDTPVDRERKRIAAPVYLWVLVMIALIYVLAVRHFDLWRVGAIIGVCSFGVGFVLTLATRIPPVHIAVAMLHCGTLAILCMDAANAAKLDMRMWTLVVLVVDLMLVLAVPGWTHITVICSMLVYLAVERVEASARFGFYEFVNLREITPADVSVCACAAPPCSYTASSSALTYIGYIFVFLTDFALTRGFAVGLRRQMALVDASVHIAEQVAVQLAAYRVNEAERIVAADGVALPPALCRALELLLANLKSYRPYLPDSLLSQTGAAVEAEADVLQEARADPPGLGPDCSDGGSAEVCLCFTDIESSTALWEAFPQGMYDALEIHNKVMRRTAAACRGYEVKTIGDAFMLAFRSAEDACRFGVEAQQQLLRQRWPADLTAHHLCSRVDAADGEALWYGLRVRAGIHWGEVRVERSPITGRCDYFGPTVNVAARIEAVVQKGGLVGITDVVLDCLSPDVLSRLGEPALHALGARDLKGVRESMSVTIMLPQRLLPRIGVLEESARGSAAERGTETGEQEGALDSPRGVTRFASVTAAVRQGARRSLKMSQRWSFTSRRSARSSDHACATDRQVSANPQQRQSLSNVALRLRQMVGSCAVARANLWTADPLELRLSALICSIESAADRSEGVLGSVLSACAIVTWNAARHCPDSVLSCQQFLGLAAREKRSVRTHFGVTTGGMLSGNIATARRRFATVVGGCIELAAALAEEAELCGDNTLAAGPVATLSANEGNAHRAQLWICAPVPPATQQTSPRFAAFAMTPVPQLARLPLQLDVGSSVQSSCVLPQESPLETEILTDSAAPSPVREHAARDLVVWSVVPQNVSAGRWDRVLLAPEARGDSGLLQARIDLAFRAAAAAADEHAAMEALRPLGEDGAHLVQRVQRGALRTRRFVEVWDPDGSPSARRASA
eukprot:TRINITY_DN2863_c0_g2_i1.p1 TRINITY_DN2863_c0_g2~~TRINITY_DN2863_c0_g2_i1.p1  ORF type:complete len:957 (+),score=235.27 TRINITY_DN2863_c0_g2_i1:83-2872(+)